MERNDNGNTIHEEMTQREKELIDALVEEYRETLIRKVNSAKLIQVNTDGIDGKFKHYAKVVADYYCVDVDFMLSRKTRAHSVKIGRQTLWWLCRTGDSALPHSFEQLAIQSGKFNHSTLIYGVRYFADRLSFDKQTLIDTKAICNLLGFTIEKVGMNYTTKNVLETVSA